jgi:hypothetical protein
MLGAADRLDDVIDLYGRRSEAATSDETRALWRALLAIALLADGRGIDRAKASANYAYLRLPWVALAEAAWGAVQIEVGDPREGLNLLEQAARNDAAGSTAALRAVWTVVAQCALGRSDGRIPHAAEERNVWPAYRRRAERALSGSSWPAPP